MADISKITLPSGSEYNIKDSVARAAAATMIGATSSTAGTGGTVPIPAAGDQDMFLRADGTWADGGHPMVVLVYGTSTWQEFIDAYNGHYIVYCRTGGRMAFMAYVNKDGVDPTEVEFQYYRSVSTKSDTQQGDETYIYKLTNSNGGTWTTQTRQNYTRVIAGTNLSSTYSSQKITLNLDVANETAAAGGTTLSLVTTGEKATWNDKVDSSDIGVNVASLTNGVVPNSQIPDSVHDILEYSSSSLFPATGEEGKLYLDTSSNITYRWAETEYVQVGGSSVPVMTGATSSTDGATGTVPAPLIADRSKYLKGDGTWAYIPTTPPPPNFMGATAQMAGNSGLVPAPARGEQNAILLGDGSWGNSVVDFEVSNSISIGRLANTTIGTGSSAIGHDVTASGIVSHAEGGHSVASGNTSHAEGSATTASGDNSHAEGISSVASGECSHAEGDGTVASGSYSSAAGYYTVANHKSQHVFGEYNEADDNVAASSARGDYVEIVGNGTGSSARSNARTLDWSGNEWLAGDLVINGATNSPITVSSLTAGSKLLVVDLDTVTNTGGSYSHTTNVTGVTADMKPLKLDLGDPSIFRADVHITTGSGTVTLTCADVSGTSTAKVCLMLQASLSSITSAEYDALSARIDNTVLMPFSSFIIPSSSISYNMPGLTENHILFKWNFSASPENVPPCDLSYETHDGYFTIVCDAGSSVETIQPIFILPKTVALTAHS